MLAASYKQHRLYSRAYKYFFKSRNVEEVCACMEHVMQQDGYQSEQDLFVARACLEMLIKSTELAKTRHIRQHFKDVPQSAILNFVDFLIEAVEMEEFEMVKQMANVDYAIELKRDPTLYEKVNTISEKYFGHTIKK